jgi:hypothetical protein
MSDRYLERRMKEFESFKRKVETEGSALIRIALNDDWFISVKEGAEKVWGGDGRDPYQCKFFPYRWLCEENQWDFVNIGLKKIDQLSPKKQMLRSTVLKIISDEWMVAQAAAFELNALCKFIHDEVLVDIEPKIISGRDFRSDALIKIDQTNILVEVTAITKDFGDPLKSDVITLSTEKLKNQVTFKIKEKAEKQLSFATQPSVLIISLLPGFGADLLTAGWSVEENLHTYPKINAYLVSGTYLFQYGNCYLNDKSETTLSKKEMDYLSKLLILPKGY